MRGELDVNTVDTELCNGCYLDGWHKVDQDSQLYQEWNNSTDHSMLDEACPLDDSFTGSSQSQASEEFLSEWDCTTSNVGHPLLNSTLDSYSALSE